MVEDSSGPSRAVERGGARPNWACQVERVAVHYNQAPAAIRCESKFKSCPKVWLILAQCQKILNASIINVNLLLWKKEVLNGHQLTSQINKNKHFYETYK